jgi:hypothetical protein
MIVFSLFFVCATHPSAGAQDSAQPKPDAAGKAPSMKKDLSSPVQGKI